MPIAGYLVRPFHQLELGDPGLTLGPLTAGAMAGTKRTKQNPDSQAIRVGQFTEFLMATNAY